MKQIFTFVAFFFALAMATAQAQTATPFFPAWQNCVQYHNAHPNAPGYVASGSPVQPTGQQTLGSLSADMAGCYPTNRPMSGWALRVAGDPTVLDSGVAVMDPRNGARFGQPVLFKNLAAPTPVVANTCPDLTPKQMPTPAPGMLRDLTTVVKQDCGNISKEYDDSQQTPADAKLKIELAKIHANENIQVARAEHSGGCGTSCRFVNWLVTPPAQCSSYDIYGSCISYYVGYNNNFNPIGFRGEGRRGGGVRNIVSTPAPAAPPILNTGSAHVR